MQSRCCNLICMLVLVSSIPVITMASTSGSDDCLLQQLKQADENMTIGWLRRQCSPEIIQEQPHMRHRPGQERLFVPYKRNYIAMGTMSNADGSKPFSGDTADIKFEFGIKYQMFRGDRYKFLKHLKFGYSQKSWWDVGEESLPFAESNYNPELFLDFDGELLGKEVNYQVGAEHESNPGRANVGPNLTRG